MSCENPIIEIKGVGKRYNINHQRGGYIALRDIIMVVLKSPFSFLKAKAKQIVGIDTREEFWALKDLSFEVQRGEVVGIIGKNGSGKSTLLKILSQITPPTTGEITIRGKVGSLLEVGTGFHPELSGRENIFLNGAILGMHKKEIAEKFDKIVEFAGVEKFIDTPVKYYSSGMYVRLAFSVAAHMEPDILIIDEVLAVGDAEFQKKCLGKMDEVTKTEGRTILFVSHNMEAIRQLCSRVVLLEEGRVIKIGPTDKVVGQYLNKILINNEGVLELSKQQGASMSFVQMSIKNSRHEITNKINHEEGFSVHLNMETFKKTDNVDISVSFRNSENTKLVFSSLSDRNNGETRTFEPGKYRYAITFKGGLLMPGVYSIRISIHNPGILNIDTREDIFGFTVLPPLSSRTINYGIGCVSLPNEWKDE